MQLVGLDYSYKTELDEFFNPFLESNPDDIASPSALCQGRKKIKHGVFIDLNDTFNNAFYNTAIINDWHGFRLCAVDGSTAHVPDTPENVNYFEGWKARLGDGETCPKARISFAYDPLNKMIIDAKISPISIGEGKLALMHLDKSNELDLNIYDRGYASYRLFREHEQRNLHYCARIAIKKFTDLCKPLMESENNDIVVEYSPSNSMKRECEKNNLSTAPIKIRLIKILLPTGEIEVLATNVFDKRISVNSFSELYNYRWGVEEEYKRLKSRIELEAFSGKLTEFVHQDFYADVLRLNISSLLAAEARILLAKKGKKKKYKHAPNMSYTLGKLSIFLKILLGKSLDECDVFLNNLTINLCRFSLPIRPGRKFPRERKPLRSGYSFPYKRAC